jgi:excisionase family DNA binding protein
MMRDNLLTVDEAAARLRVPVSWIYERTRMNAMPGLVRIGKYVRISESALDVFIAEGGENET